MKPFIWTLVAIVLCTSCKPKQDLAADPTETHLIVDMEEIHRTIGTVRMPSEGCPVYLEIPVGEDIVELYPVNQDTGMYRESMKIRFSFRYVENSFLPKGCTAKKAIEILESTPLRQ